MIAKISQLFKKLLLPLTSVDYYKSVVFEKLHISVIKLFLIIFMAGLAIGIKFSINQTQYILDTVDNIFSEIRQNISDDFYLEWKNQQLTLNTEYLELPWPENILKNNDTFELPNKFLLYSARMLDPNSDKISTSEYFFVVNTSNIYTVNMSNIYTVSSDNPTWVPKKLTDVIGTEDEIKITSQDIKNVISNRNLNSKKIVPIFLSVTTMLIYVFNYFIFWVFESVLVIIIFKLFSINLSAKQILKLTMNIMIPTLVLTTVCDFIYANIDFPIITITFWILIIFMSFQFREKTK